MSLRFILLFPLPLASALTSRLSTAGRKITVEKNTTDLLLESSSGIKQRVVSQFNVVWRCSYCSMYIRVEVGYTAVDHTHSHTLTDDCPHGLPLILALLAVQSHTHGLLP